MILLDNYHSNWKNWHFYNKRSLNQEIQEILNKYTLTHFLSPSFDKKIDIYLSRQDTGLQLSICIRIFNKFIIWAYWENTQGIVSHRVSLQYHQECEHYIHIADLMQNKNYKEETLLRVIPGYDNITAPYTSLYRFIIQEKIPITWKCVLGFVNSLKGSYDVNSSFPTRLILECYQSGNPKYFKGDKITKAYFFGY